jgi:pimeloyl-ACP methyl ester carboxylesterase
MDGQRIIEVNGVDLCVDTTGDTADPAILLISGMGGSMDSRSRSRWLIPIALTRSA